MLNCQCKRNKMTNDFCNLAILKHLWRNEKVSFRQIATAYLKS